MLLQLQVLLSVDVMQEEATVIVSEQCRELSGVEGQRQTYFTGRATGSFAITSPLPSHRALTQQRHLCMTSVVVVRQRPTSFTGRARGIFAPTRSTAFRTLSYAANSLCNGRMVSRTADLLGLGMPTSLLISVVVASLLNAELARCYGGSQHVHASDAAVGSVVPAISESDHGVPHGRAKRQESISPLLDRYREEFYWRMQKEPLRYAYCSVYDYPITIFPNLLGHETQEEAQRELRGFGELIESKCSSELPFLLCSFYFPIAVNGMVNPLVACKNLCKRVRRKCSYLLAQHGLPWPKSFNCEGLPRVPELVVADDDEAVMCYRSVKFLTPNTTLLNTPLRSLTPPPSCPVINSETCTPLPATKKSFCRLKPIINWAIHGVVKKRVIEGKKICYKVAVYDILIFRGKLLNETRTKEKAWKRLGRRWPVTNGSMTGLVCTSSSAECPACPKLEQYTLPVSNTPKKGKHGKKFGFLMAGEEVPPDMKKLTWFYIASPNTTIIAPYKTPFPRRLIKWRQRCDSKKNNNQK